MKDVEHLLDKHKNDEINNKKCVEDKYCIHFKRAITDRNSKKYLSLSSKEKFNLFNTNNPYDIIYVSLMSRLHCLLKHNTEKEKIYLLFGKDIRYIKYPIFGIGVFVNYHCMLFMPFYRIFNIYNIHT